MAYQLLLPREPYIVARVAVDAYEVQLAISDTQREVVARGFTSNNAAVRWLETYLDAQRLFEKEPDIPAHARRKKERP